MFSKLEITEKFILFLRKNLGYRDLIFMILPIQTKLQFKGSLKW